MLLSELPFELLGTNVAGPLTGITIAGVDLANLYAPASAGVASGVVTGFNVAGVDLGTLFAGIGTASSLSNVWANTYTDSVGGLRYQLARAYIDFKPDCTYVTNYGSGRWLAAGLNAANYEIIAVPSQGTLSTNNMATFAVLDAVRTIALQIDAGPAEEFQEASASCVVTIRNIITPASTVSGFVSFIVNAESAGL